MKFIVLFFYKKHHFKYSTFLVIKNIKILNWYFYQKILVLLKLLIISNIQAVYFKLLKKYFNLFYDYTILDYI